MDQDERLVPTQGRRPEDLIEGPMIRRLCICRYQCPLCMEDHEVQLYISLPATDLDEYVAQLKKHASRWEVMQPALTGATIEFHEKQGDLPELARRAEGKGLPQTTPPTLELTGESEYTCDHCSKTFDSAPDLRAHMERCGSQPKNMT